jgi:D-serine deaminase-like pyridoxal phosphate-dependent protein
MPNIYDLDTPALLVDLDRLAANITAMARTAASGGKSLRPHCKTHKTVQVARMQVEAGARGLTVAKLGEAEALAAAGFDDLFIANQIVGPTKIERLLKLAAKVRVCVGVDSLEVAEPLATAAHAAGESVPVSIEVDTGLGRAGARSVEEVLALGRRMADMRGIELVGIFTHEGHLYRAGSAEEREALAARVAAYLRELAEALAAQGTPAVAISAGSTPGAPLLARHAGPTELRPGVYVFNDRMQVQIGGDPDSCALSVLATVTSVRSDGKVIVDAGTKSLASDCPFPDRTYGEIMGHPEAAFVGASEEHGHLQMLGAAWRVGDHVRIVPNHACTCVNMHDSLFACRGESVEDEWPILLRGKIR